MDPARPFFRLKLTCNGKHNFTVHTSASLQNDSTFDKGPALHSLNNHRMLAGANLSPNSRAVFVDSVAVQCGWFHGAILQVASRVCVQEVDTLDVGIRLRARPLVVSGHFRNHNQSCRVHNIIIIIVANMSASSPGISCYRPGGAARTVAVWVRAKLCRDRHGRRLCRG